MGEKPKKLLLDTDIGSDIDDAVCLAYLLRNPMCELLGITTVSGMARERAMIADTLCRAAGKDVPIRVGAENPLIAAQRQPLAPQAEKLPKYPHAEDFAGEHAISLMRRAILANPGEVTLLAIGPMTNVALLFAVYPDAAAQLGGLAVMGGDFLRGGEALEWNIICDPHAASMMYACGAPSHRSVGLNATTQVTMAANEVRERFSHPLLRIVADYAEVFFRGADAAGGSPTLTFHDPLAAVALFDAGVCEFARGEVSVDLSGGGGNSNGSGGNGSGSGSGGGAPSSLGKTTFRPAPGAGRHEVASAVSPEKFFEAYFSVFK
ncbi:MAG: nucleoside hydrolase [Clostridiales bacterium]|jgi:inosine-uridine nucleoside N-ribohydrolase|nr:nucleoside hydrolase [Clostridiales bacterium]